MKKIITFFLLYASALVFAQKNQKITYNLESKVPKDTTAVRENYPTD